MACALFITLSWIVALCVHEFCHAVVAYIGGDKSVKEKGYLTLNPIKYTDPGLTLLVPVLMLMLGAIALPGAAVYVNRGALRNRLWRSAVSLAGPVGSALTAIAFATPFICGWEITIDWLRPSLAFLILLQVVGVILNSLPLPPLDGYGVIEPWLPVSIRQSVSRLGMAGIWILFALLWFVRPLNNLLWFVALTVTELLGVPAKQISVGYGMFSDQKYYLIGILVVLAFLSKKKRSRISGRPSQ